MPMRTSSSGEGLQRQNVGMEYSVLIEWNCCSLRLNAALRTPIYNTRYEVLLLVGTCADGDRMTHPTLVFPIPH
jgi:hypothetical protein